MERDDEVPSKMDVMTGRGLPRHRSHQQERDPRSEGEEERNRLERAEADAAKAKLIPLYCERIEQGLAIFDGRPLTPNQVAQVNHESHG
jgi:hypothetical protein